jgi:hypothetical protein
MMFGGYSGSPGPRFYIYHPDQWNATWYRDQFYRITGRYPTSCDDFFTNPDVYEELGGVYGTTFTWAPTGSGQWHTITERIAANIPGQWNGIAEGFIDGSMVSQVTNLRYRFIPELKIDWIDFVSFFGGSGPSCMATKDEYIYFDDILVYRYLPGSGQPSGNTPSPSGRVLPAIEYPGSSPIRN